MTHRTCPRCSKLNFADATSCYSCACAPGAGQAQPAARPTASFAQEWGAASAPATTKDRADLFLEQQRPEHARKTDTRHLLLHSLSATPAGLFIGLIALFAALSVFAAKPSTRAQRSEGEPAKTQAHTMPAEERDLFKERDERRRERRWRESRKKRSTSRASDAFRSSSR